MLKTKQFVVAGTIAAFCAGNVVGAEQTIILASLGDVSGKVLINKGQGFVAAKSGMGVRPGDRVIALDKASAKVMYTDGCVTDLQENNLLAVDGKGCETKPVNSRANNIKLAAAVGGTETDAGGAVGGGTDGTVGGGTAGGVGVGGTLLVVVGGLAVVGLMAHDNKGVSIQ